MEKDALTQVIKEEAHALGFTLAGVTGAEPPRHLEVYSRWLAAGRHGSMGYLATERARQRRADPRAILPECQSILVLGIPCDKPLPPKAAAPGPQGRLAAYAGGDDYHEVLKERLQALVTFIEGQVGSPVPNRWYTDTGPILERELAQRAGLGWIGKNTLLINPQAGSYFLLAEILLGIELQPDEPISEDHCGSCTRCLEACPTQCILPDRTLDARRCISYLTIELKEAIPADLRGHMEQWVFGCDVCQEVCPWNERFAEERGDPAFAPRPGLPNIGLEKELALSPQDFNARFKGSPVKRAKRRGYLRNVAVALGNAGAESSQPTLAKALEDAEPLVRGHAAWALGQIGGAAAAEALETALRLERDVWVREEIEAALEAVGV